MSKTYSIVTHNGSFHADDVFAYATLLLWLEKYGYEHTIVRTRDEETIQKADIVIDVGNIYDPTRHCYDHHQVEGAGARDNGIPYASFGLVWKHFGPELTPDERVYQEIEERLVQSIDASDNGIDTYEPPGGNLVQPYLIQYAMYAFRPTWREDPAEGDKAFVMLAHLAKGLLGRLVKTYQDMVEANILVEHAYDVAPDKRIIELDGSYPWQNVIVEKSEPLFVVYPRTGGTQWGAKAVPKSFDTFENRVQFPANWRGLRDEELQEVTGVPNALFCHRAGFLVVAETKEGVMQLVHKALANS